MPHQCCVPYCRSKNTKDNSSRGPDRISFHKFPDPEKLSDLWERWVRAIRRVDPKTGKLWFPVTQHVYVCSQHFHEFEFELGGPFAIRRLRENVVPSIFSRPTGGMKDLRKPRTTRTALKAGQLKVPARGKVISFAQFEDDHSRTPKRIKSEPDFVDSSTNPDGEDGSVISNNYTDDSASEIRLFTTSGFQSEEAVADSISASVTRSTPSTRSKRAYSKPGNRYAYRDMDYDVYSCSDNDDNDPIDKIEHAAKEFWRVKPDLTVVYRADSFREIIGEDIAGIGPVKELSKPAARRPPGRKALQPLKETYVEVTRQSHDPDLEMKRLKAKLMLQEQQLKVLRESLRKKTAVMTKTVTQNRKASAATSANPLPTLKRNDVDLNGLRQLAMNGNLTARFLIEQATALLRNNGKTKDKEKHHWSDFMLRYSLQWRMESKKSYEFARSNRLLTLPSRFLLKKYVSIMSGDQLSDPVLGSSAQQLLKNAALRLRNVDRRCLLIVEDIDIPSKADLGFLVGNQRETVMIESIEAIVQELAAPGSARPKKLERVLSLSLRGFAASFSVPVGYFLTENVPRGEDVHQLIINVLSEAEKVGFVVLRLAVPDCRWEPEVFRRLSGIMDTKPQVQHPLDSERHLFLSYDARKIAFSVYQEFIGRDNFVYQNEYISKRYLLEIEKMETNSKRGMQTRTPIHLDSKKLSVSKSDEYFSWKLADSLEKLPQTTGLGNPKPTAEFVRTMWRWLQIQKSVEDGRKDEWKVRAEWLMVGFSNYLDEMEFAAKNAGTQFLSKDVLMMLRFSTISTALLLGT